MPRIAKSTIDEVQNRMDAVSIVNDYVRLEKRGGRYLGLCPFHNEKTPSFQVNPDLKLYYCFGCHKGGTVLDFVMEMDKLSYPEAIETLARRLGVSISYDGSGYAVNDIDGEAKSRRKEELYELYRRMAGTFQYFFQKTPEGGAAKGYIISRGISAEMLEKFQLGYAPEDRNWLYSFLSQKGYSGEFLDASGLFSSRYKGLPLFQGRLMFPITDRQGRVVAFGGRALAEGRDTPKYINSPETPVYRKGETLFALFEAVPEIRRTKTVYIAEGYMDVIALHQAGISNSVAPLGTAFTEEQAKLLLRWAEKAVLVFDTDRAGQEAAVKSILICRKTGLPAAVIVPEGDNPDQAASKDPADILRNSGPESLQKQMKCIINDFDYLIRRAKSLYDTSGSEGKSKGVAFIFPYLETMDSDVLRDACIESASAAFAVSREAILNDLRRYRTTAYAAWPRDGSTVASVGGGASISMNDELFLLMVVAVNDMSGSGEPLYPAFRRFLQIGEIENPDAKELFIALEECFVNDERSVGSFLARISRPELQDFFLRRGSSNEFLLNPNKLMDDGIRKFTRKKLEKRREEIVSSLKAIKKASSGDNSSGVQFSGPDGSGEVDELLAEKIEIDNELCRK
jgi:DNA primase